MKQLLNYLTKRPKLTLLLALAWTLLIFIGCSLPGKDLPKIGLFDHFDKLVHFTFFLIFFIVWRLYFTKSKHANIGILIVAIWYGLALEFYQLHFVAGRSFDVWDAVADTLGALAPCILFQKNK